MKKYYITLPILVASLFFSISSHAQNTVKDKVVGCWKIDAVIAADSGQKMDIPDSQSSLVCLKKDGRFTTTTSGRTVEGDYKVSEDGKTMTQKMDGGMEEEGAIAVTDAALEIKTPEVIIKLVRVKE
ncbi:hypothetical protein [Flavobacterium pallidum]|uniref:Lipocalin-like domain-containing protein n=1 Tax=Flavobacterium pallidum TaxID=2172098 RepID=A0A2S1SKK7_9FLAO|nr:hypothetical protein [Flavobacterium pallidum]AWI26919.1 hypothetical protein HYN49_13955 [Flavobacterium pallidum]